MMDRVIFSPDNWTNTQSHARFLRHLDNMRAMQKLYDPVVSCIGFYKDKPEVSYMVSLRDFNNRILPSGWVDGQESVLVIKENNDADLWYKGHTDSYTEVEAIGKWTNVPPAQAMQQEGCTYVPNDDKWYTCL